MIDHHVHVRKIVVKMEDCEYTSSSENSETENELDDIRDIEDNPAFRKRSVVDNGSTILSGE